MTKSLRTAVVVHESTLPDTTQAERTQMLRAGLLESGFHLVATLAADASLDAQLAQLQPDLIILDSEHQARDALQRVLQATRNLRRPIVVFTNDDDTTHVQHAVAAGVCAYIVADLARQRIRPILDVALARFAHEQALHTALADAQAELHDRKTIDQAKTLLMQRQGLSEQAAYEKLRKTAMDKGLKLGEVARRMLEMAELLV